MLLFPGRDLGNVIRQALIICVKIPGRHLGCTAKNVPFFLWKYFCEKNPDSVVPSGFYCDLFVKERVVLAVANL